VRLSAGPTRTNKVHDDAVHRRRGGAGQPAAGSRSKLSAGNGATGVGVATGSTAASLNGRSDTTRDWFIF
jgi:hypothetical protein